MFVDHRLAELADAEALTVDLSWDVRRTDLDFLVSPAARDLVRDQRIEVVDYHVLQRGPGPRRTELKRSQPDHIRLRRRPADPSLRA
jgi:hypothetical protein